MKKMKRLVAVLLAGVMILAMLTACGGTGNGAPTAKFEDTVEQAYMAKLNDKFGEKFENDPAIKKLAVEYIEKMAGKEKLNGVELWSEDATTQNQVMICYDSKKSTLGSYVMLSYEADTTKTITPDEESMNNVVNAARIKAGKNAKIAVGVGVETIKGKTYVAIGFRVEG